MANLGSFSVDIRAGTANLTSDLGKAKRLFGQSADEFKRQAADAGKAIGAGLAAGFATAAVAIKSAVNRMDDISKSAQKIGITTQALSGLEFAARLSDVSLEQLSGGVLKLTKNLGEAAAGNRVLAQTFGAIGISTQNADGSLRKTEEVLGQVSDVFKALPDGAEKSKLAIDLFGRSGAQLIPLLNSGSDGLAEMTEEARALGIVFSEEAGKQAEEFNDALTRVQAGLEGAATQVAMGLLPKLTELTDVLQSEGFREGFGAIVEGAATATIKVAELVSELGNVTRFAGEEVAARIGGPEFGDTSRIQDAIEFQRRQIDTAESGGPIARFFVGSQEENIAELERLEELLRLSTSASEENAAAEQQRAQAGIDAAANTTKTIASGEALLKSLRKLREEQGQEAESTRQAAEAQRDRAKVARESERAVGAATKAAAESQARAVSATASLNSLLRNQESIMGGPIVQASAAYAAELETIAQLEADMLAIGPLTLQEQEALARAREQANQIWVDDLADIESAMDEAGRALDDLMGAMEDTPLNRMRRDAEMLGDALEKAFAGKGKYSVEELQGALGEVNHAMNVAMISSTQEGLRSLQSMTTNGSKAFSAFQVAIDALSLAQAISAVLNQGQGDPYTAFARMAAMAAAVATLVGSIGGSFGGSNGFTDTAASRQESQGTGTILGDAEAKSESILNAMQITADATSELVGINQGMLRALQSLQGGLDAAGGMLARGAGRVEFPGVGGNFDFASAFLGGALSSLPLDPLGILGGSSRVTDQGIALGGGGLDDLNVQAYQEQQYRRWRFGSRRTQEDLAPVGAEFAAQFGLIVDSITETVRQGAIALGMLPAEVETALAAFRLEEIRISLKDLSADEQQAELLAVFSSIFDGLAGSVVPYIEQFQRVGEGLGETLVRVATGVQVTQEAVTRLGFSLDATSGEQFAIVSEGLIEMAGGLEEFISGMLSFVDNFAPEAHKFAVAQDEINRAFEQVGLTVPATRDGMWDLMQSLDATTESGRLQIATLLRLTDTANTYYTMLERAEEERVRMFDAEAGMEYAEMVTQLNRQLAESEGASEFHLSLQDIAQQYRANVARLNELAQAAGLAGAREEDLATALQVSTMQRQRAILALEAEGRALVQSLGLDAMGLLDAEIAALSETEANAARAVQSFGDAITETAQAAWDATQLLLGDLSPLRDREKLALALQGQEAGSVTPEQVLQIGRRLFASGSGDYGALFAQVMQIGDRTNLGGGDVGGGPVDVGTQVSTAMQELLDRRAELEAGQREAERYTQAAELAQIIADSAGATGDSFAEVAARLGLTNLDQLLQPLGLENTEALTSYLTALQADSYGIEDIAATITAGDQLIVDTLRQIFDVQNLARMIMMDVPEFGAGRGVDDENGATVLRPGATAPVSEETGERQIDAVVENGERLGEGFSRLGDEIVALKSELSQLLADIRSSVARSANSNEALAETTAQRGLIGESVSPRASRFGASVNQL
jgi:hypothetical protein